MEQQRQWLLQREKEERRRDSQRAAEWLSGARMGYCGTTLDGVSDCRAGALGSLVLPNTVERNWAAWVPACLRACEQCDRCKYVSMSLRYRDCR